MEDKRNYRNSTKRYQQYLEHCESFGISNTIIKLFIHLQEQKHEQDNKEAENSWL